MQPQRNDSIGDGKRILGPQYTNGWVKTSAERGNEGEVRLRPGSGQADVGRMAVLERGLSIRTRDIPMES